MQLARRLEVGAARARFGEKRAAVVRKLADGLGAARVDAENVNHASEVKARGHTPHAATAGRSPRRPLMETPVSAYQYSLRLS